MIIFTHFNQAFQMLVVLIKNQQYDINNLSSKINEIFKNLKVFLQHAIKWLTLYFRYTDKQILFYDYNH